MSRRAPLLSPPPARATRPLAPRPPRAPLLAPAPRRSAQLELPFGRALDEPRRAPAPGAPPLPDVD